MIATVGTGITELTPSRGFAATLAAATTVVVASGTGLPISTTHVLVGAILGVGLAMGSESLNYRKIGSIFVSWLVTLPAGAILSILFFFLFRGTGRLLLLFDLRVGWGRLVCTASTRRFCIFLSKLRHL